MKKQQWIILLLALAMIGGSAALLARFKAHQRLGAPGIKTAAMAGSQRLNIYLPERVLDYNSKPIPTDPQVLEGLPHDTSFAQRYYANPEGDEFLMNVVLMGTDRTSIHKPQFCLKGSGWDIDDAGSTKAVIPMQQPHPYDLPVMKLTTSKEAVQNGERITRRGIYVYWFVADNQLTESHWGRMRKSATHLLSTGELQRWAYIFCFSVCKPGDEDITYERMKKFIAASVPQFQLAAGPPVPRVASRNPSPMAAR